MARVDFSLMLVAILCLSSFPVASADVSDTLTVSETTKRIEKSYELSTRLAELTITAEFTTHSTNRYYAYVEVCYNQGNYDDCFTVTTEEPYQSITVMLSGDRVKITLWGYAEEGFQYNGVVDISIKDKNVASLYFIMAIPFVILAIALIQVVISKSKSS